MGLSAYPSVRHTKLPHGLAGTRSEIATPLDALRSTETEQKLGDCAS